MAKYFFIILIFFAAGMQAQDTSVIISDTIILNADTSNADTSLLKEDSATSFQYFEAIDKLLSDNKFLNADAIPQSMAVQYHKPVSKEIVFYSLAVLLLFFGMLKVFYSRYMDNMFRVFFNSSLRQSQLTDQLLQARQPSLLFNIFFVIMAGFYIYFLLHVLNKIPGQENYKLLLICIASVAAVYVVKFIVLKFSGWVSGFGPEADTYIFIIFLINKIIGIILIPIVIIFAFSENMIVNVALILSFVVIFLMLVMRFFRSFALLRNKIKVSRLHFFLYIAGVELLPLLLIYKTAIRLLGENS